LNWHDSGRFCAESLESAAKRYKTLGFSIIPLQGARNPQQPKLPAIRWARYQHTVATDQELHEWFGAVPEAGIGIVCGRLSRLMVLDFDDESEASEFRHLFPDLVQTFVVRSGTRRLPHFYYRLPIGKVVPTAAYRGVDIRGEGSYVVAPPTRICNMAWTVEHDAPIREVTEYDLRRIMGFVASRKRAPEARLDEHVSVIAEPEASEFRHMMRDEELVQYYRARCCRGRNQALFQTAVVARDMGIMESAFVVMLAGVHAAEPGHSHEAFGARYAEAVRTIRSAYSRPAHQKRASTIGLSNGVREWLLSYGLANVARVIDGLYVVGMKPDELFTEAEACERLAKLKIGRRSIVAALRCVIDNFEVFGGSDAPRNPPLEANAAKVTQTLTHSCEMSRGAKRVKNGGRGRPARAYRLPPAEEIAQRLGVSAKSGDGLTKHDFESAKMYREALHEKLLERRPGHYARAWLAQRLGVSRWTARRYEKARGVLAQAAYTEEKLTWNSARRLPELKTGFTRGTFIETQDGKRYPAVRGLALKLLKADQGVVLRQQRGNFYAARAVSVGIPTPQAATTSAYTHVYGAETSLRPAHSHDLSVGIPTVRETHRAQEMHAKDTNISENVVETSGRPISLSVGIPTPQQTEPNFWLCPDCLNWHVMERQPERCMRCGNAGNWEILSPLIWHDVQALKVWWQQRYREHQETKRNGIAKSLSREPVPISESDQLLADRLHTQVPDLSLKNARQLVSRFSSHLIEKGLSLTRLRGGLRNPAGFLISFLKSESAVPFRTQKDVSIRPKGESAMDWLRRLAKSEYLNFISNVDDILNIDHNSDVVPALG
jgi:hypothetical protein